MANDVGTVGGNGAVGNTFEPSEIESPKKGFTHPAKENEVEQSNAQPGIQSSGNPTASARETVQDRYKEIEEMVAERLDSNPDFQKLKAKLEALKQFEKDFALIDAGTFFGRNNNAIALTEVMDVAADKTQPEATRQAAERILANKELWNQLAAGVDGKNDNLVGANDVGRLLGDTAEAMNGITNGTRSEVKAEMGVPTSGAPGSTASQNASAATSASQTPSPDSLVPRPPPSTLPGMDGATENLAITADYLQAQMMALAEEAAKDPSKATLNAQKIAMLQNKFQAVTNMMNQLTQMISNMSKMWSDVAMNSIRNLR